MGRCVIKMVFSNSWATKEITSHDLHNTRVSRHLDVRETQKNILQNV